jgi:hypothetical protein
VVDPRAVDELDGAGVVVVDGVRATDEGRLGWCGRAPCVVVGVVPAGEAAPGAVDVALGADDGGTLDRIVDAVDATPAAARTLVQVLRAVPALGAADGLVLESLAYSTLLAGSEFARWLAAQPPRPAKPAPGPPVRLARHGDELRITLARPGTRNALSAALRDALVEALEVAEVDASLRVVVDGEGPSFCSGGDLTEFGTAGDVVRAHQVRVLRSVGAVLARLAPRVTMVVHGRCVGAGVELPAFAGRVEAAGDATFRLPELAMGLIPGAGGTVSITRRVGRQAAARLALLGDEIDVHHARRLGLVDVVDDGPRPPTTG